MKNKTILVICIVCASLGCIKQVSITTRMVKPVLVVEGSISNDSVPYTVTLSYSVHLRDGNYLPDSIWVPDATVTIADAAGNSTLLTYMDKGVYQTTDPAFIGKVGQSYAVTVLLQDGRKYISTPEIIQPAVPIKNVTAYYVNDISIHHPTYLNMQLDVDDPPGQEHYYRWKAYTWLIRKTLGVPCGGSCVMFEYCYQKNEDKEMRIYSDVFTKGNTIKGQPLGRSYIYWYGRHYLDVQQESTSREAYQFLNQYNEQLTRSGDFLSPLPASIKGNIHNAADEKEFALGYFYAAGVTHKRYVITPYDITEYLLNISNVLQYVPIFSVACFEYYDNAISYPPLPAYPYPPPPGWEKADSISVHW